MPKFRKIPVEVKAIQYTGDNFKEIVEEIGSGLGDMVHYMNEKEIHINTSEGTMIASVNDWIIKEPFPTGDRNHYPCKPDIFEKTYEPL